MANQGQNEVTKDTDKLRLSWAKLKINLVDVGDKVKVDVIVEVTTCQGWWVGG